MLYVFNTLPKNTWNKFLYQMAQAIVKYKFIENKLIKILQSYKKSLNTL